MTEQQLRQKYVGMAQTYLNAKEGSAAHKKIIDIYNSILPHPRNYKMTYTAPWCAPFVSANAIMCDMLSIFAFECSCTKQIEIWKSKGRWIEDDAYRPQMGDIIYYDWNDSGKGDNTGLPDHVGIVVYCDGNDIKVIEGNKGNMVSYRTITVNGKNIRGFAVPDYASLATDTQEEKKMTFEQEFTQAKKLGITDGTNPDSPATRKQVAVMIYRAIKIVFKLIGKVEV